MIKYIIQEQTIICKGLSLLSAYAEEDKDALKHLLAEEQIKMLPKLEEQQIQKLILLEKRKGDR